VDYAYDGMPIRMPFFIRWIMHPLKRRILNEPMRSGSRIPRVSGGTLATAVVPTAEGIAHLQRAYAQLAGRTPTQPPPLLGRMTHDGWIALTLRHAELHLSFLKTES
jgi:hypothetical protein